LLNPTDFRDLVSGRRRGLLANLVRGLLAVCEIPYSLAMAARNACFDRRIIKTHRVDVPVVSVGNLTMGGTGKTPMVQWLTRWFQQRGVNVALVSRGYKSKTGSQNDEALELAQKLPDVPHLQNPDRVAAAKQALEEHDCQLILLDDAFQHRRIHRDLDIVLVDALEPFGFERVFPRGTLRERLSGLSRADVVALSRADTASQDDRKAIRTRVEQLAPSADWGEVAHQPGSLLASTGERLEVASLAGQRVVAFCGIGNPAGFRHTVQSCGCELVDFREFPDHHEFLAKDVAGLEDWANRFEDVTAILCTHKDLVKINRPRLGPHPLWALTIELDIGEGKDRLETRLQSLLLDVAQPANDREHGERGP